MSNTNPKKTIKKQENKQALAKAQELADNILSKQRELAQEMLELGMHPDDWVMVDNLEDVLDQKTNTYICRAQFLLKQDRLN